MAGPGASAGGSSRSEPDKRKNESSAELKKAAGLAAKIKTMLAERKKREAQDKAADEAAKKRRLADQRREEEEDDSCDLLKQLAAVQPDLQEIQGEENAQIENDPEPPSLDESIFQPPKDGLPAAIPPPATVLQQLKASLGTADDGDTLTAFNAALEHGMTDLLPNNSTLLSYCFRSACSTGCPHAAAWLSRYYHELPQATAPAWCPSVGDFLHALQAVGYTSLPATSTNQPKSKANNSTQQQGKESPETAPGTSNNEQQEEPPVVRAEVYAQALDRLFVTLQLLTSLSKSHLRHGGILDFSRSAQSECVQCLEALLRLHMVPSITQRHLSTLVHATQAYVMSWSGTQEATWSAAVHKVSMELMALCPSYMSVLHVCCLMDVEVQALHQLQQACLVALLTQLVQPTKGQAKDGAGPRKSRGTSGSDLATAQHAWQMVPGAGSKPEPSKLLKALVVAADDDDPAQSQQSTTGHGRAAGANKKAAAQRTDYNKVYAVLQCIFHIVWPLACNDSDSTAVLTLAKQLQQYVCTMSNNVKSSRNLTAARVATTCAGLDNLLGFSISGLEPSSIAGQNGQRSDDDDDGEF